MIIITTSKFDLILRHERPCTQAIAHTYYIMLHQELAYTSWLIFI